MTKLTGSWGNLTKEEAERKLRENLSNSGFSNNSTLQYGASGRGEFLPNMSKSDLDKIEEGSSRGVPMSVMGDYQRGEYMPIPRVTANEALGITKKYGLQGFNLEDSLKGLTRAEADQRARELKELKLKDVSSRTSSVYSPEVISGFNKKLKDLQLGLDSVNNDPFISEQEKKDKKESTIQSYIKDFADIFGTNDVYQANKNNPEFQKSIQQFEQLGGQPTDIESQIQQPQNNIQSLDQYLGRPESEAQKLAMESLFPESQIAQAEIAFEQNIPEQLVNLYFGSEDELGLYDRIKKEEDEAIKLIEKRAKLEEKNAKAQAQLVKEKNQHELRRIGAEIEENRLNAKNYMTGQLAKLGALKTTGAAPEALAKLEQRYQEQKQKIESDFYFKNQEIDIELEKYVAEIDLEKDENILKIRQDLTKKEENIWKEIYKAQQRADERTFSIVRKMAEKYRTVSESYRKELKKDAEKFTLSMSNIISDYDVKGISEGMFVKSGKTEGVVNPFGQIIPSLNLTPTQTQQVQSADIRGEDTIRTFISYPSLFRNWYITEVQAGRIEKGLSRKALENKYNKWTEEQENSEDIENLRRALESNNE